MTDDEKQKLNDLHDFFMKPPVAGKPSRAQQIDDALNAIRSGKFTVRALLWACGAVVAVLAAWNAIRGGFGR